MKIFSLRVFETQKESTNEADKAVSVIRTNSNGEEELVGSVPKNISKLVFMFLSLPNGAVHILVTKKRVNQGGV